ncbi:MAG TPA: hypothetical protein VM597_04780 [Gemmataceae bacterium]|nr:hypothetical protein [Gemmataceae bacterium]
MTRELTVVLGLAAGLSAGGCGNSTTPNTAKMTDEEVRRMKEEDRRVEDDERSGSGAATPNPRKRR